MTGEYDTRLPLVERLGRSVVPGMGLLPLHKEVTFEQMAVFSRLGEFVRNIHNDLVTARAAGLDVPILQGQQQFCYLAELGARAFGRNWFTGGWLKVKFIRPIKAFEAIEVGGVVRELEPDGPRTMIDLDVWVRRSDGSLATVGWARASVDSSSSARAIIPSRSVTDRRDDVAVGATADR